MEGESKPSEQWFTWRPHISQHQFHYLLHHLLRTNKGGPPPLTSWILCGTVEWRLLCVVIRIAVLSNLHRLQTTITYSQISLDLSNSHLFPLISRFASATVWTIKEKPPLLTSQILCGTVEWCWLCLVIRIAYLIYHVIYIDCRPPNFLFLS